MNPSFPWLYPERVELPFYWVGLAWKADLAPWTLTPFELELAHACTWIYGACDLPEKGERPSGRGR